MKDFSMIFLKELQSDLDDLQSLGTLKSVSKVSLDDKEESNGVKDPNRHGLIRTIKDAHLIYKRENDTSRFDELWMYKIKSGVIYQDIDIKTDILSGTDIPMNNVASEDGEQTYDIWYSGDIVFLKIYD